MEPKHAFQCSYSYLYLVSCSVRIDYLFLTEIKFSTICSYIEDAGFAKGNQSADATHVIANIAISGTIGFLGRNFRYRDSEEFFGLKHFIQQCC
jgi:hypothetical protein